MIDHVIRITNGQHTKTVVFYQVNHTWCRRCRAIVYHCGGKNSRQGRKEAQEARRTHRKESTGKVRQGGMKW